MAVSSLTEIKALPALPVNVFAPPEKIDIADFFVEPEPFDFVLPGMLKGTVGAIVSPGGAGKSMYTVQAATAIAGGADLLGLDLKLGSVVYLPAEDPKVAIHHRFFALSKNWNDEQRESVRANFSLYSLIGQEPDLFSDNWFQWIDSLLAGKRILFLDTLRRFHKLEENDSGEMAEVVGRMEAMAWKQSCSIVFLHHASKSAAMGGQGDQQQASRGSSVLVDNIRWQAYLSGCSKDEAKKLDIQEQMRGYFVRTGISKQNYGPPVADTWMRRGEGGVLTPANLSNHFGSVKNGSKRDEA